MRATGCCDVDLDGTFDARIAANDLAAYRRDGLEPSTRLLRDLLVARGVEGLTLLDIGGGIGAIHHDLLRSGMRSVTDVDGSSAYIACARQEAERQGHADRITYHHGDLVRIADEIGPADVVTLVAVLCCYPDMASLVQLSAARARRFYGLVYPRSTWWMRAAAALHGALRPGTDSGPGHVHDEREVDAAVRDAGLVQRSVASTWYWRVTLYERTGIPI